MTSATARGYRRIVAMLGGPSTIGTQISSEMGAIRLIESGIPFAAVEWLERYCGLGRDDLCAALGIGRRTLARRKSRGRLYPCESERLWRVAQVLAHAADVFGSPEKAGDWVTRRPLALGGARPIDLLRWEVGGKSVDDLLGRLEHGVVS